MKTAILAAALLAATVGPMVAQEKAPRKLVQKVIQLKSGDPRAIQRLLGVFDCSINVDDALKAIALKCYDDVMPAVEDVISRFDVSSPRSIELTAYFLVASDKPEATGAPVPAELDPVIKQIQTVFAFKNFSLLDAELIRGANGEGGQATGRVTTPGMLSQPTLTQFKVARWSVSQKVVSLENLRAGLHIPVPNSKDFSYVETGLTLGKVDVPIGEKVVIGKSSMDGSGNALIIVLSARLP